MKILYKKIEGFEAPVQANEGEDAAYDIAVTTEPKIVGESIQRSMDHQTLWKKVLYIEYGTDLFIAPESEEQHIPDNFRVDASGALCDVVWKDFSVSFHTQLYPRSSISKYSVILANSVATIDGGYRDQIFLRFKYLFQPEDFVIVPEAGAMKIYGIVNPLSIYQKGEKAIQIKAHPTVPISFESTENLPPSKRGLGKFGSSGR